MFWNKNKMSCVNVDGKNENVENVITFELTSSDHYKLNYLKKKKTL